MKGKHDASSMRCHLVVFFDESVGQTGSMNGSITYHTLANIPCRIYVRTVIYLPPNKVAADEDEHKIFTYLPSFKE